jgi:radical SAM superfamily enzyme YgiQ (UPF0313 family)
MMHHAPPQASHGPPRRGHAARERLRIALVWPADQSRLETLPLSLGTLFSAIAHQGHDVRLFNFSLEQARPDDPKMIARMVRFAPDLVATTGWPNTVKSALATARTLRPRLPDATFAIGGNYATLNTEAVMNWGVFDYVFRGEVGAWPRFVEALAAGAIETFERLPGLRFDTPDGRRIDNPPTYSASLDEDPVIDFDFIELERYFSIGYMRTVLGRARKGPVFASRGCPHVCKFCTAPLMNGRRHRHHSVAGLMAQIRTLYDRYGVRHINFMDDNPTHDMGFFKDFCREVIEADLPDLVLENYRGVRLERLDNELLHLMKRAGFKHLVIAPETGSASHRLAMGKTISTEAVRRVTKEIRAAGLGVQGFFMVGYPGETREDRQATYDFIRELDLDVFKLHKFVALPGTPIFHELVARGAVAPDYTPEGYLLGNEVPEYLAEQSGGLDAEIFNEYARFYLRYPHRLPHLLRGAPVEAVWRSAIGLARGAARGLRR